MLEPNMSVSGTTDLLQDALAPTTIMDTQSDAVVARNRD
jgi:hypothetical protein